MSLLSELSKALDSYGWTAADLELAHRRAVTVKRDPIEDIARSLGTSREHAQALVDAAKKSGVIA